MCGVLVLAEKVNALLDLFQVVVPIRFVFDYKPAVVLLLVEFFQHFYSAKLSRAERNAEVLRIAEFLLVFEVDCLYLAFEGFQAAYRVELAARPVAYVSARKYVLVLAVV